MDSKYLALPLPTDTEAETSFDLEKSFAEISKKAENATIKRRSLFNGSIESIESTKVRKSREFESAKDCFNKEIKEWRDLFYALIKDLKQAKQKHTTIDISILSAEKRKFLSEEPDADRYLRTLHEFQCDAQKFLDLDFVEKMSLRENIADACMHKMQLAQQLKLNDLICAEATL